MKFRFWKYRFIYWLQPEYKTYRLRGMITRYFKKLKFKKMKKEELGKVIEAIIVLIISFCICAWFQNHV